MKNVIFAGNFCDNSRRQCSQEDFWIPRNRLVSFRICYPSAADSVVLRPETHFCLKLSRLVIAANANCPGYVHAFLLPLCPLGCIKVRIDFAIIENQSGIDFFLALVVRAATPDFSVFFYFRAHPCIFPIAPLSTALIFSVIDSPGCISAVFSPGKLFSPFKISTCCVTKQHSCCKNYN